MAITPDGTWLATGGGRTVRIWDTASWTQKATLTGHEDRVGAMAIAPDGTWLATTGGIFSGGTVQIWDVTTGRALAMMRVDNAVLTCAWIDPRRIAVGGNAGLYMFDFLAGTAS